MHVILVGYIILVYIGYGILVYIGTLKESLPIRCNIPGTWPLDAILSVALTDIFFM